MQPCGPKNPKMVWLVSGLGPSPCPASTCLCDLFQVTWHLWATVLSLDLFGVFPFESKSPVNSDY